MRVLFNLLLLFLCGSLSTMAQVLPESPKAKPAPMQASLQVANPYVTINSQETALGAFILEPEQIKTATVSILKEQEATARFGSKAKEGAVVMELEEDIPLARVQEVYDFFKVPQDQQRLKLTIDDKLVKNKELLLADIRFIEKLEVKTRDVTAITRFSFEEDTPYLNIVTVKQ